MNLKMSIITQKTPVGLFSGIAELTVLQYVAPPQRSAGLLHPVLPTLRFSDTESVVM